MDLLASDTTGAAVLVGIVAPWIIALVNQPHWSKTVRSAVAVVISGLLGAGIAYAAGTFHSGWTVLGAAATVLATSQAVYGRLFAGSQRLIECLTSRRRPQPAEDAADVVDDVPGRHSAGR